MKRLNRRTFGIFVVVLMLAVTALAGCGNGNDTGNDDGEGDQATADGSLEVFSWWTRGGEAEGFDALIDAYKQENPGISVVNATISGGAGSNAKAVLATRMQGGDPPDLFQVHSGEELNGSWVAADKVEPITDLFESEGWMDKYPQEMIDLVSVDGEIYSVPVNIHRANVLWYNKSVFEQNGLKVPETMDDFFEVSDALQAKGIIPFAFGSKEGWESQHVFETVLISVLGVDGYNDLWTGDKQFDDADVKEALSQFEKVLSYANEDHPARSWQDATELLINGDAAMMVMGDWMQGYFASIDLKVNEDYGYAPAPGNEDVFLIVSDSFALPKGAKNHDEAIEFLKVIGSKEGQDAFNPKKGSIPARTDAGEGDYDVYLQDQMEQFKTNRLAPSLAHGSAANEGFLVEANQVINLFTSEKDVERAVQGLQAAADSHLQ